MTKKSQNIKTIGVFTSGGDAPGMNAAIRAVVRAAAFNDLHVFGIYNGYQGMVEGNIHRLEKRDVANIIHRGGTILKTSRSELFRTPEGRKMAFDSLMAFDIDACICIGGDGTYTGAKIFSQEFDIPFIGLPGTIDNDIYGTDYTIGFDTAINTAIEAIDRIRDTADSHDRIFIIEVMGRHSGYIGLYTGIGSGASHLFIPETDTPVEVLIEKLKRSIKRNKLFNLVVVAEGNQNGDANTIANHVREHIREVEVKVTIIGHLQRGGSPTCQDRVLASRLGASAVGALLEGHKNVAMGVVNNKISMTTFDDAISKPHELNKELIKMTEILAM